MVSGKTKMTSREVALRANKVRWERYRREQSLAKKVAEDPVATAKEEVAHPSRKRRCKQQGVEFQLSVDGLKLKLLAHDRTNIGTLLITATGLRYMTANQKKPPERELTYGTLRKLAEVGIG